MVNRFGTTLGDTHNSMSNSNPSSIPTSPRVTLKLKTGARMAPRESETAPNPRPQRVGKQKSGAQWSDEFKERMQRDMDALAR
jgi:hypothetical protein